jgi:hypothetical protein
VIIKYIDTIEDLEQVHCLRKKYFRGKFPGREFFIDASDLNNPVVLMFNNDGEPIGTVRMVKNGSNCKLEMLCSGYAGRKGFVCILSEIVAYCEAEYLKTLSAHVNTDHVCMWEKMGAVAGEEVYLESVGANAIHMTGKVSDLRDYLDKLKVNC